MPPTPTAPEHTANRPASTAGGAFAGRPAAVPEHPVLAPGVRLVGELEGAAFKERQWLVERDGAFLQVTELLYGILERVDGQRSPEDIAAGLSAAMPWEVSGEHVRQLLRAHLIPAGLVVGTRDTVVPLADPASRAGLLGLKLRLAMVSPRLLHPLTWVLQILYAPFIVGVVLTLAVLLHGWLYVLHGAGDAVSQALSTPGLFLAIVGLLVISDAFHELGHAAALRYGGGRARGMGVGLYLVFPVFYTDVTDAYRLGRWARLRTDLGGFYFNQIFALGIAGLYLWTRQEFLLAAVLLIDLGILHQLLPFVRLDGYWALADLTGIPDFFSQIGAFLRSILPLPWWTGTKLPRLKWWATVVFGLYILVAVPLLALAVLLAIQGLPRALATAEASFASLAGAFSRAQAAGDTAAAAAAVVQIVALALPTLGLLLMLSNVSRHATRALVSWSGPTRRRQVIGSLVAAGTAALIASWWAPMITPAVDAYLGHLPASFWQVQLGIRQVNGELSSGPAPRNELAGLSPGQLDLVLPGVDTASAVLVHNLVPVVTVAAGAAFFAAVSRRGRARRPARQLGPDRLREAYEAFTGGDYRTALQACRHVLLEEPASARALIPLLQLVAQGTMYQQLVQAEPDLLHEVVLLVCQRAEEAVRQPSQIVRGGAQLAI